MIYQLAAIGAGICFALSPFFSIKAVKLLGPTQFNKWRMLIVFFMLTGFSLFNGGLRMDLLNWWFLISISSVIGIFLGDTLLLHGLKRIGPRRNSVIFALNAPLSILMGWLFLDEKLPFIALIGTLTITSGVIVAIAFGRNKNQHDFETVQGRFLIGLMISFGAALCQAISLILMRPAMESGVDPIAASAVRVGIAAVCLWVLSYAYSLSKKHKAETTPKITAMTFFYIAFSGFLAMGLGMSLLLFGLKGGDTGVISTLSSISPVISVLLLWIIMKKPPAANAWIGAILVVSGTAILFLL